MKKTLLSLLVLFMAYGSSTAQDTKKVLKIYKGNIEIYTIPLSDIDSMLVIENSEDLVRGKLVATYGEGTETVAQYYEKRDAAGRIIRTEFYEPADNYSEVYNVEYQDAQITVTKWETGDDGELEYDRTALYTLNGNNLITSSNRGDEYSQTIYYTYQGDKLVSYREGEATTTVTWDNGGVITKESHDLYQSTTSYTYTSHENVDNIGLLVAGYNFGDSNEILSRQGYFGKLPKYMMKSRIESYGEYEYKYEFENGKLKKASCITVSGGDNDMGGEWCIFH